MDKINRKTIFFSWISQQSGKVAILKTTEELLVGHVLFYESVLISSKQGYI